MSDDPINTLRRKKGLLQDRIRSNRLAQAGRQREADEYGQVADQAEADIVKIDAALEALRLANVATAP